MYQAGAHPYGAPVDLQELVQQDSLVHPLISQVAVGSAQLWMNPKYHVLWTQVSATIVGAAQGISSITASVWINQPQKTHGYSVSHFASSLRTDLAPTLTSPLVGYHPGEGQSYAPAGSILTTNGGSQWISGSPFMP